MRRTDMASDKSSLVATDEDTPEELDLKRIAAARQVRRLMLFVATAIGAALFAKFNTELLGAFKNVKHEQVVLFGVPESLLIDYLISFLALATLLYLIYEWALTRWKWHVFVPMVESKRARDVALGITTLTSLFARAQRTAQARSLMGAIAIVFGIIKLWDVGVAAPSGDASGMMIAVLTIVTGALILAASFLLRYGFSYSVVVMVPLLEAVIGAETSAKDEATIRREAQEIVRTIKAEKPWWFYRPAWFY